MNHAQIKHLEVNLHFVREHVQWGDIVVPHVSSTQQLIDIILSFAYVEDLEFKICGLAIPWSF